MKNEPVRISLPLIFFVLLALTTALAHAHGTLTQAQLMQVVVPLEGYTGEKIQLSDGAWEGSNSHGDYGLITVMPQTMAFGDLNRDGSDDGVMVIAENWGGSGAFMSLKVFLYDKGLARHAGSVFLGDRIDVRALKIENNAVTVHMYTHGPNDGLCCPTQHVQKTYAFTNSGFLELATKSGGIP